jgi:hypothetical protein
VTFRDHTQSYYYVAYGLSLSSNLPIATLFPISSLAVPDVQIKLGALPMYSSECRRTLRYISSDKGETGKPDLQIWDIDNGEFFRVLYSDGVEFWLDRGFQTLWAHWPANSSFENTLSYLVGPILGLLLRLRGTVCLHASAVSVSDRAVVFVGSEGAGKSTTAAAFARQGYPVLSDDIVGLVEFGDEFRMVPAYPRVNLWPDSVKLIYGSPDALPPIMPDWDKRCLKLGEDGETRFEERTLPIGGIYILGDSSPNPTRVETISRKSALMLLIGNTYATNFLDAKQRAAEFAVLSRVVATVPVRKIRRGEEAAGVEELRAAIQRDFASIKSLARSLDH